MISGVRNRIGTAGLVVAIIALVAALGGGAYAASGGLTPQQKKQVKKIARTEAKKLVGTGPAGAPGATGPAGANGKDGTNGTNGKDGEDGEDGQTGFVEALPSNSSLTGTWGAADFGVEVPNLAEVSFPIPVNPAPTLIYVVKGGENAYKMEEGKPFPEPVLGKAEVEKLCPGNAAAPAAEPGFLCVFVGEQENADILTTKLPKWGIATPYGDLIPVALGLGGIDPEAGFIGGTWAVTAG